MQSPIPYGVKIRFTDCWAAAVCRVGEAVALRGGAGGGAPLWAADSAKMHPDMVRGPAPGFPWRTCIVRR